MTTDDPSRQIASARPEMTAAIMAETGLDEGILRDLVYQFYAKVRLDAILGPIFAARIENWGPHLERRAGAPMRRSGGCGRAANDRGRHLPARCHSFPRYRRTAGPPRPWASRRGAARALRPVSHRAPSSRARLHRRRAECRSGFQQCRGRSTTSGRARRLRRGRRPRVFPCASGWFPRPSDRNGSSARYALRSR